MEYCLFTVGAISAEYYFMCQVPEFGFKVVAWVSANMTQRMVNPN